MILLCHVVNLLAQVAKKTAGEGIVEFFIFNCEKGFGRLGPFNGFTVHVVDASRGSTSALQRGAVVQFKEPDRQSGGKRRASRVRVKPS